MLIITKKANKEEKIPMNRTIAMWCAFMLAQLGCLNAHAQIYKCPDSSGRTVFQQAPCSDGKELQVHSDNGKGMTDRELQQRDEQVKADALVKLSQASREAWEAACRAKGITELRLGMSKEDTQCVPGWRFPKSTNTTATAGGVREQVVYGGYGNFDSKSKYLYFENGKLTAVQQSDR